MTWTLRSLPRPLTTCPSAQCILAEIATECKEARAPEITFQGIFGFGRQKWQLTRSSPVLTYVSCCDPSLLRRWSRNFSQKVRGCIHKNLFSSAAAIWNIPNSKMLLKKKYPRGNRILFAGGSSRFQTLQAEIKFPQSIQSRGQGVISAPQNILGGIASRIKAVLLTGMPICVRAWSTVDRLGEMLENYGKNIGWFRHFHSATSS